MVGFLLHIIFVLFKTAKNVFIFVFYIVVYIFKSTELVRVKKDRSVRKFGSLHFWSASNTDMIHTGFQQHACIKTAKTFLELKLYK